MSDFTPYTLTEEGLNPDPNGSWIRVENIEDALGAQRWITRKLATLSPEKLPGTFAPMSFEEPVLKALDALEPRFMQDFDWPMFGDPEGLIEDARTRRAEGKHHCTTPETRIAIAKAWTQGFAADIIMERSGLTYVSVTTYARGTPRGKYVPSEEAKLAWVNARAVLAQGPLEDITSHPLYKADGRRRARA